MAEGRLVSIQVGRPQVICDSDPKSGQPGEWTTGFVKQPVKGALRVGRENLDGDGQADLKHHGGPDKAILGYCTEHYAKWEEELRQALPFGGFGENFSIAGMSEETVCVGDTYVIGEVTIQVSQPRQPCWKTSRRWGIPGLEEQIRRTSRTGWYYRVLTEGWVEAGLTVILVDRPNPAMSIHRANQVIHRKDSSFQDTEELASCPFLATSLARQLNERMMRIRASSNRNA